MNIRTVKLLSAGALCLMAGIPTAWGGIQVVQEGLRYRITVDPGTAKDNSSLVLAWDTEDRGETLDGWAQSCEVATINSNGGEFFKPIEDIPEGSVVRAFATRSGRLLKDGSYVELTGNQYFVTDVKENLSSGMEMTFVLMDGACNWSKIIGGTADGFTIGRNNASKNSVYVRCHDGNEIGLRPSFTEGGVTTISLKRGGNEGKTGVLCVNGSQVKTKDYSEPFVLYNKAQSLIHIGTTDLRKDCTYCKWYSVKFWDLDENLVRNYAPACVGDAPCLYDTVNKTFLESEGTGSVSKFGDLGDPVFEVVACSPVAKAKGDIQVIQESRQYRIIVAPGTVNATASLVLVWDTEDRGRTIDGWTGSRVVANINSDGGEFTTPSEGIPAGGVVRAFATQSVQLLQEGGYVELSGNQYFVTDVKENLSSGMEMTFVLVDGACNYSKIIGGTVDAFTFGRWGASKSQVYVRCHDGEEIGLRPTFTEGGVTTISLKRGGNEGKTGVLCVNGSQVKTKDYSEPFVLCRIKNGVLTENFVHIGTSALRVDCTYCKWYSVKFWDLNGNLVREYVPACVEDAPCLYDTVSGMCLGSAGTGAVSSSGTLGDPVVKVAAFSPLAKPVDPKLVVKATWTGTAGDGALFNPGNWDCINLLDEKVEDGIPGALADITLTGEIDMNIAENQVLTGRSVTVNATLKHNASWMGHIQTSTGVDVLPAGSFLEMNGHNLTLAGAYIATENQWTIRNSAEGDPATLCVVTAEGKEFANKFTWFRGNLRLEKRGAGTYVAHTQDVNGDADNNGSDFTGGTYLIEGVTRLVDGTWWHVFGGDRRVVHVGPNATLDTAGCYHIANTPIYLDGGTILQSKKMTDQNGYSFGNIILTADSMFRATADTVINTPTVYTGELRAFIDLQGHTLTFDLADNVFLDIGKLDVSAGLIKVVGNGKFRVDGRDYHRIDALEADFDLEVKHIELYNAVTAHDFTCRAKEMPQWGDPKDFSVSGTFRPVTQNFTKTCLRDGATLSLVDQAGTWSTDSSAIAKQPEFRVVFPETGTIYVDVTGRTDLDDLRKSDTPYLVRWHEDEVPKGVKFVLIGAPEEKRYRLTVDSTGLRLHKIPGFKIFVR